MEDFYVTLPSNSNLAEFSDNQPNNFKVRLAEPLRLHGGGWSVGLSSVSLPDEKINLFSLGYDRNPHYFKFRKLGGVDASVKEEFKFDPKEVLMKVNYHSYLAYTQKNTRKNTLALDSGNNTGKLLPDTAANRRVYSLNSWNFIRSATCTFEEVLQDKNNIVNGVELMRFLVTRTLQSPLKRMSIVNALSDSEDQPTVPEYEWVEHVGHNELRVKKKIRSAANRDLDYVRVGFNIKLAVAMGWLTDEDNWTACEIGNNLEVEDIWESIESGPKKLNGSPWYLRYERVTETLNGVQTRMVYFNPYYTWHFFNFKSAFQTIMGSPSRSLLIYSDVVESSKVGDQVVDLLREVEYKREDKATVYFEPTHIQYLPVRNEYIEMIQTQVSETNGNLAKLRGGHTLVTLHFKRQ